MPSLYDRARNYVAKMPAAVAGQGGHDATFKVACVLLQGFNLTTGEAREILHEFNVRCAPPWSDRELEHKLAQADKADGLDTRDGMQPRGCLARETQRDDGPGEASVPSRARSAPLPSAPSVKPTFQEDKLRAFAAGWRPFVDTAWLAERSPVLPYSAEGALSADGFLRSVFRDGEKVVVFTNQESQGQALWPLQRLPEAGDDGVWFLAQPVDGREHPNPRVPVHEDGSPKMSRRSEESVTSWRHMVLESDKADARDWLAALVQLPLRVVAIYTSGGRSIHALVRIDAPTKQEWDNISKSIQAPLIVLGADKKALSAVRLTRLPGCLRAGKLQKLLYLNPNPEPVPICRLPKLTSVLEPWIAQATQALAMEPSEVWEQDCWPMVEKALAALEWFEMSSKAREVLGNLRAWMQAGGEQ